jgi:hypothetical protein
MAVRPGALPHGEHRNRRPQIFLIGQPAAIHQPIECTVIRKIDPTLRDRRIEVVVEAHHTLKLLIGYRKLVEWRCQLDDHQRIGPSNPHIRERSVILKRIGVSGSGKVLRSLL